MNNISDVTILRYRVRVGHIEVVVSGSNDAEAIANARRELARDLPRFYDLIRGLDATRFNVVRAA